MSTKRIKAHKLHYTVHSDGYRGPAWELPADAESYDRMVEQMAVASMKHFACKNRAKRCTEPTESTRGYARAELRAIGIKRPKGGRK